MTLRELSTAIVNKKQAKIPEHCRSYKRLSDGSANDLTTAILAYFDLKGVKAWRQKSEGRYLRPEYQHNVLGHRIETSKGKFIPGSKASKGIGDIAAILPRSGKFLSVEVKFGKDRQSEDQIAFQKSVEESGAIYLLAKNWDGFIVEISKYL